MLTSILHHLCNSHIHLCCTCDRHINRHHPCEHRHIYLHHHVTCSHPPTPSCDTLTSVYTIHVTWYICLHHPCDMGTCIYTISYLTPQPPWWGLLKGLDCPPPSPQGAAEELAPHVSLPKLPPGNCSLPQGSRSPSHITQVTHKAVPWQALWGRPGKTDTQASLSQGQQAPGSALPH